MRGTELLMKPPSPGNCAACGHRPGMVQFLIDRHSCEVGLTNEAVQVAFKRIEKRHYPLFYVYFTFPDVLLDLRREYDRLKSQCGKVNAVVGAQALDGKISMGAPQSCRHVRPL